MKVLAWLLVVAISTLIFYIPQWFRKKQHRKATIARWQSRFFDAADQLSADNATPLSVLRLLQYMSHNIDDSTVARRLLWDALTGDLQRTAEKPTAISIRLMQDIQSMKDESIEILRNAVFACISALSYQDPLLGVFVRRMIFFNLKQDQRPATVVMAEKAARSSHFRFDPHDGQPHAAMAA